MGVLGNIGFDEGGVTQGIAAILEALQKEGITREVVREKTYKSGRKKTTTDTYHISLVTPASVLLIWLLFELYKKIGGVTVKFDEWLRDRLATGYYAKGVEGINLWAFATKYPELYARYMGEKGAMPETTVYTSEPAEEYYDPATGRGGGKFFKNIGPPDETIIGKHRKR